jgi:hypothetical protein
MGEQVEKRIWEGIFKWSGSAAGIAVILTVVVAAMATLDRGPYVLVNTVVIGGMLALVAMGLALVFGVMNIPMFAHGEYFMIGTLTAYYVFTPINTYITTNPGSVLAVLGPLITIVAAMIVGGRDGGGLGGGGFFPAQKAQPGELGDELFSAHRGPGGCPDQRPPALFRCRF